MLRPLPTDPCPKLLWRQRLGHAVKENEVDDVLRRADEILKDSHHAHFHAVYDHLLGKEVDTSQLWLSVGYFLYGRGRFATLKPWRNEEQRGQLLQDTGRNES